MNQDKLEKRVLAHHQKIKQEKERESLQAQMVVSAFETALDQLEIPETQKVPTKVMGVKEKFYDWLNTQILYLKNPLWSGAFALTIFVIGLGIGTPILLTSTSLNGELRNSNGEIVLGFDGGGTLNLDPKLEGSLDLSWQVPFKAPHYRLTIKSDSDEMISYPCPEKSLECLLQTNNLSLSPQTLAQIKTSQNYLVIIESIGADGKIIGTLEASVLGQNLNHPLAQFWGLMD